MDDRIRLGDLGRIRRPRRKGDDRQKRRDGDTDSEDVEGQGGAPAEDTTDRAPDERQRELPPGKGKNLDVDT